MAGTDPLRSHSRRQVGEFFLAAQHGLQLGEFFVAAVIAAFFDVVGRDLELLLGVALQRSDLLDTPHSRFRRIVLLQHAVERRERFDFCKREPRALERDVAEKEPHRPGFGDLLGFIEIARGAVPVADAAMERGAGKEAAGKIITLSGGAQAVDGLVETGAGGQRVVVHRC
jgi:hypothetical protein